MSKENNPLLIFTYSSKNSAIAILNATKIDNYKFVKAKVKGNKLISEIKAKNISSLIHTIEDYLSCISIAEKLDFLLKIKNANLRLLSQSN